MKPVDKAPGGAGGPRRQPGPGQGKCAECGQPVSPEYRPFCSKRCADIDLGRWLKGGYAVPGAPADMSESSTDES